MANNQTSIFKVKIKNDKRVYRVIELSELQNLDDLHYAIIDAFDFDDDHLYSFFMDNEAWSDNEYCSPRADGKRTNKIKLGQLNLSPKQKFLYLYDYGDQWEFEIEFVGHGIIKPKKKYPQVLKTAGNSPEQY